MKVCVQTIQPFALTLLLLIGCKSEVIVNSDIKYQPVKSVSLNPYKSVQFRDPTSQNPNLTLGVSIAGGGSRAQYFGIGVLLGLEEIKDPNNSESNRNFLSEIDYLSTVSGGGFAAGYYLTIKKNVLFKSSRFSTFNEFWLSKARIDSLQEFLGAKSDLKEVLNAKRYEKNKKSLSFPSRIDWELLQYSKIDLQGQSIDRMFLSDLFIPAGSDKPPLFPILVTNGTIYNNLERLPFMPHIIEDLQITRSLMPEQPLSSDNTVSNGYNLPLTYAITASSAFPGILPQVKFGIKESANKVIRVIDGGVVDNLGYTTLIELLKEDKNPNPNKRALIIDCSAAGQSDRFSNNEIIKTFPLVEDALLFTVDSKYMYHQHDIQTELLNSDIPRENYFVIGISTLRTELNNLDETKYPDLSARRAKLRSEIGLKESNSQAKARWENLFFEFETSIISTIKPNVDGHILATSYDDNNLRPIDLLTNEDFENITPLQTLLLYELASQIETRIQIWRLEKSILTLAGRYAVFLKRKEIEKLYQL